MVNEGEARLPELNIASKKLRANNLIVLVKILYFFKIISKNEKYVLFPMYYDSLFILYFC